MSHARLSTGVSSPSRVLATLTRQRLLASLSPLGSAGVVMNMHDCRTSDMPAAAAGSVSSMHCSPSQVRIVSASRAGSVVVLPSKKASRHPASTVGTWKKSIKMPIRSQKHQSMVWLRRRTWSSGRISTGTGAASQLTVQSCTNSANFMPPRASGSCLRNALLACKRRPSAGMTDSTFSFSRDHCDTQPDSGAMYGRCAGCPTSWYSVSMTARSMTVGVTARRPRI